MPRINPVDPATASGRAKELLDIVQQKFGFMPNLARTMVVQPAVLDAWLKFGDALGQGSFDARTREAVALTISGANACNYCASVHSAVSQALKIPPKEIEYRLAGYSDDPKLDALLKFTRTIVSKRGEVTNADVAAVKGAGYDNGAIIEIVANVALNILTNYLSHVAETDIDFPHGGCQTRVGMTRWTRSVA